jgi:hypothetical protein
MTRWSVGTLAVTLLIGPWAGCERGPVTPPAAPPAERAPLDSGDDAIILIDGARTLA